MVGFELTRPYGQRILSPVKAYYLILRNGIYRLHVFRYADSRRHGASRIGELTPPDQKWNGQQRTKEQEDQDARSRRHP